MKTFTAMADEWMLRRDLEKPHPQPTDSAESCNVASHDSAAWNEAFHHWALDRCVYCERWLNGIGALHRDFRDWCLSREEVPCDLATFVRLLLDAGFLLADGLVNGLTLRRDWDTYEFLKENGETTRGKQEHPSAALRLKSDQR